MIQLQIQMATKDFGNAGKGWKIVDEARSRWSVSIPIYLIGDVNRDGAELRLRDLVSGKRLIAGVATLRDRVAGIVNLSDVHRAAAGIRGLHSVDHQRSAEQRA